MVRLTVNVGFREGVGFESTASHQVTRSFAAADLKELRRKITAATLMKRRKGEDLMVSFLLDSAARRELDRKRAGVEVSP